MKQKLAAILGIILAATILSVVPSVSHASAQGSTDDPTACDPSRGMWFMILFDTSGSLRQTDPQSTRRTGAMAAINDLVRLQQNYPQFRFYTAVDGFASAYSAGSWVDLLTDSEAEVQRLLSRTSEVSSSNRGGFTNYKIALEGALERFQLAADDACKSLIWFTDGEHDTVRGTTDRLTAAESAQIDELCAPDTGAAGLLTANRVSVTAVHLSAGRNETQPPEPLRRLYGDSEIVCEAPLSGAIVNVPEVDGLARILREFIEDEAFESAEQPPPTEACTPVRSTNTPTCEFLFTLDGDEAEFEMYVNFKGVTTPQMPAAVLVSPDGTRRGLAFSADEGMHRPSGFLTFAATSNWRKISGHQSAEFSDRRDRVPWQWEGEWKLVFEGQDSRQVRASQPRYSDSPLPQVALDIESPSGSATGYVDSRSVEDFVGYITFTVDAADSEQHGLVVGQQYYPVDRGGIWGAYDLADILTSDATYDPLLLDSDIVYLKAQLVQNFEWDGEEILWPVLHGYVVVPIHIPRSDGWSGRYCRIEDQSAGLAECTYSFSLTNAHEAWLIDVRDMPEGAVATATLTPPDGDPIDLSFHNQAEIHENIGFLSQGPSKGHYQINGHRVAEFVLHGTNSGRFPWVGSWELEFVGDYSEMSRADAPQFTLIPRPIVTVRHDYQGDRLIGQLDAGNRQFDGRVMIFVDAPDKVQNGMPVGDPTGYEIDNGQWQVDRILRDVVSVPGIFDILRAADGEIALIARLQQNVTWATDNQVPWLMPEPQTPVTVIVPEVLGWNMAGLHPRVSGIEIVSEQTDLTKGVMVRLKIAAGRESGTVRLQTATASDADGEPATVAIGDSQCTQGSQCEVLWTCHVPQRFLRDTTQACDDLWVQVSDLSGSQARLHLFFISDLDHYDDLVAEGANLGFEPEAELLYADIEYEISSEPYLWTTGNLFGRIVIFLVFLALLWGLRTTTIKYVRKSVAKRSGAQLR